jgi:hypothetical protein
LSRALSPRPSVPLNIFDSRTEQSQDHRPQRTRRRLPAASSSVGGAKTGTQWPRANPASEQPAAVHGQPPPRILQVRHVPRAPQPLGDGGGRRPRLRRAVGCVGELAPHRRLAPNHQRALLLRALTHIASPDTLPSREPAHHKPDARARRSSEP